MVAANTIPAEQNIASDSLSGRYNDITEIKNNEVQGTPWYSGILSNDPVLHQELDVKVIDNGNAIEFILPRGTAQFAEIFILDTTGKIVWKTQSFNQNSILWHKDTIIGSKVPRGRYTFNMKQSNRQVSGLVDIQK